MSPPARVHVGRQALETAFAWPSGTAAELLAATDGAMGAVRARMGVPLGNVDPFHVRAALVADPQAIVVGCAGRPLSRDAVDATLLASAGMAGILAFQPLGPVARAVIPDPAWTWLRWRRPEPSPLRIGRVRRFSPADLPGHESGDGLPTYRCLAGLPRGGIAIGSDCGLSIGSAKAEFRAFPWPAGARRENRRVEALLGTDRELVVGTQQALFTWDYRADPRARKHPADADGGYDDLLALALPAPGNDRVRMAWRTHLEGAVGPADILAFAADPHRVLYAGTRGGEVWVVDGGGPIRRFVSERVLREGDGAREPAVGRPVRHLAFAAGRLWAAADGGLHAFDGVSWTSEAGEPGALTADEAGRLWFIREGRVWVRTEEGPDQLVETGVSRPWALLGVPGAVWVGGVGGVAAVSVG